jgi:hypothetical protein
MHKYVNNSFKNDDKIVESTSEGNIEQIHFRDDKEMNFMMSYICLFID